MKHLIIILSILLSTIVGHAQSQLAMSFTGNYNIANQNLENHFKNGIGGSSELYYFFKKSSFAISLSFSINQFGATSSYLNEYKRKQENILNFSYSINYYTIPVLLSVNYRFFKDKLLQPSIGIGAGYFSLTHKTKQRGEFTSDTQIKPYHEFGIYPHASLIFNLYDNIGLLFKTGYNLTLNDNNISYVDFRFGVIYKI